MAYKARKRKGKKNVPEGIAHIKVSYNNAIITITDVDGNTVSWASAGTSGYKGSKKKTPFAAGVAAENAAKAAYDAGMRKVEVVINGVAPSRDTALRSLITGGLEVTAISDVTPVPHNGCRPPKRPRG
jgi:small subunit ribosomal protein S11